MQTHLELSHDDVGGALVVAGAELLLPPAVAHTDRLDLIIGGDDLRHLLEGRRARDAYTGLTFIEALEVAQLVGQRAPFVRVVHATAPGQCRGDSAGRDAGERASESAGECAGAYDVQVHSTYQREVRRENFFLPRVNLLLFDMTIDTTRLRWDEENGSVTNR